MKPPPQSGRQSPWILVYLEDRDALQAWTTAIGKAAGLADAAFGPDLPACRYQPRGTR